MTRIKRALAGLAAAAFLAQACWAAEGEVFAVVDGAAISAQEFEAALAAATRDKFYHRQPREDQLAALRHEVTDRMVNRMLLLNEAQRRGIRPDEDKARAGIAAYEQRNRHRPRWQESRAQVLPLLTRALQEQSMIVQLEAAIRAAPPPAEAALRGYYESHPERFTEPERVRLSMILLKVDPSAPGSARQQALQQAQDIVKRLADGADFAELARLHSDDSTASAGGDMGYRHRGMLPPGIESEIGKMVPGATSEPLMLLEGVAIFRLNERTPARLRRLEEVRANVAELWQREQGDAQWRELIRRLRAGADITISGHRLPASAGGGGITSSQTAP